MSEVGGRADIAGLTAGAILPRLTHNVISLPSIGALRKAYSIASSAVA
jgi:hypothetical protein